MISPGMELPAGGINYAKQVSQQLLELEMGTAFPGGSFEYFAEVADLITTFDAYSPTLRCLDQRKVITGIDDLKTHMIIMNDTSSQTGLDIASQEVQCSGTLVCAFREHLGI